MATAQRPVLSRLDALGAPERRRESAGGRALGLMAAGRAGLPLVETWLLPAWALREHLALHAPGHDLPGLIRGAHRPAGALRVATAREAVLGGALAEALVAALTELAAGPHGAGAVLLLSASATAPEGLLARLPALGERAVAAPEVGSLAAALRAVWSSALDIETLVALKEARFRELGVGVLVQRVPAASASGTLLTWDPAAPEPRGAATVIAAELGLGAHAEEGELARDLVRLDRDGAVLEHHVAPKVRRLTLRAGRAVEVAVRPSRAARPALGATALRELAALAREARAVGGPRASLRFVMARGLGPLVCELVATAPPREEPRLVATRATFGDSLPGVPTPLTWSLAREVSDGALRAALTTLGVRPPSERTLLIEVDGRPYLDAAELLPAAAAMPGVDAAMLVELLDPARVGDLSSALGVAQERGTLIGLGLTGARLLALVPRLTAAVSGFEELAERQRRWLTEMDLGLLPDDALETTLRECRAFHETTATTLASAALAAVACHTGLQAVLARALPTTAPATLQALSAGVGRLATLEPALALFDVVAAVRHDPGCHAWLSHAAPPAALPEGAGGRAFARFLEAHGERAVREAELSTPRWREAPAQPLTMVHRLARGGAQDPGGRITRARLDADRALAEVERRATLPERALVHALLVRYRELLRIRERMRVWIARTLAMLRTVALDVDRRLGRLDPTLGPGAVFHLELDELADAVRRERTDLGPLVRARQAAWARRAARPDPPESFWGRVPSVTVPAPGAAVLRGAAASPGVGAGRVCRLGPRLAGLSEFGPGDILVVTAPDPCLVPLFPLAGAVAAESGSALAHAGVLARELGVPAVLGVPGLMNALRHGERVRVDGTLGVVERIAP